MLITADKLIVGDGRSCLVNHALRVDAGRIVELAPLAELSARWPEDAVVDYGAATILPGLIDMHIHLAYYQGRAGADSYNEHMVAYLALNNAERQLRQGVTTLRDVYCPDRVCDDLIQAQAKGWVRVPRIIHCNQVLTISGGADWQVDGAVQVDGVEEIRKAVREQLRSGATWTKCMTSNRTPGVAEFDQQELNMIVTETHRRGAKAAAHSSLQPSLTMCIEAGFDTIEHGTDLTLEQAKRMAEKGIAWVPTIYVHMALLRRITDKMGPHNDQSLLSERDRQTYRIYSAAVDAYRANFLTFAQTGLAIAAGTDLPFDGFEDISVAAELAAMVECGWDNLSAIAAATGTAARVLGLEDSIGVLAPGLLADMLVVEGDAAADISALTRVKAVYQGGELAFSN